MRLTAQVLLHRGARPRQALLCRASVDQNTRAEVERASKEVLAEEVTEGAPFADSPGDEIEVCPSVRRPVCVRALRAAWCGALA